MALSPNNARARRAVIDHTIERILLHPSIDGLYLISEHDSWWGLPSSGGILTWCGSTAVSSAASVLNALQVLSARADRADWVLVHDAARPCAHRKTRSPHSHAARPDVGGLLRMPVHDTMKRTDAADRIVETVARTHLWRAFTPPDVSFRSTVPMPCRAR